MKTAGNSHEATDLLTAQDFIQGLDAHRLSDEGRIHAFDYAVLAAEISRENSSASHRVVPFGPSA